MNRGNHKGFTIIELLIAMAVMAYGILGFTFLNSRALQNRTFSRDLNRATVTAERITENLVCLEYDDPLLADDADGETWDDATSYPTSSTAAGTIAGMDYIVTTFDNFKWFTFQQENQRYHLRWRVTTTDNSLVPDKEIKRILIYAAFDKKNLKDGGITYGGYNPDTPDGDIIPTIVTFKMDPDS